MKRVVLTGLMAGACAGFIGGCKTMDGCPMQNTGGKVSYYKDGKFDDAKAKQAYFDLMKKFNVPIYSVLEGPEGTLWAAEFGKGDFERFGMGGVFWMNEPEGYLGHEIYLLPFQSIPEHRHVKGDTKHQAKMESWQVRYGYVYGFSEVGEPNLETEFAFLLPKMSPMQREVLKSKHVEKWVADGRAHKLPKVETWHFMMAGPEGAIVTETATFHDNAQLQFTVPGASL